MQDILNAGLSPEEIDRRFEASGERMTTPCYDGDMVWRVWGEGPPLVLLHGGYGSWRHWIKNIGPLSQRRRVFVADNPGLGDSASVPLPHSGEKLAAVIVEGIDQLIPVPERFDLVGFSFGGLLGGHVASMMGDRVRNLVVIAPGGLGIARTTERPPLAKIRPHMSEQELVDAHRHNLSVIMFHDMEKIDDLALYLQQETVKRARVKSPLIARTDTLARVLPNITANMNAIYGEMDDATGDGLERRQALFRSIHPDIDFRVIDGAGHWVMYETPEIFNTMVQEMIGRE
ncbi:MAG: alpha/beta hydrolase [Rhodospirillaceae bacterium]|nr:alpha/beta hydrolase [Rhodospirillaceae bacterium]MDD9916334.1 alpha/beta hydrolase [Rhodospirillaceae bacterium]MDD9926458.1 alpha/beta hydrolase [Rhodospirillaceae bacterium]